MRWQRKLDDPDPKNRQSGADLLVSKPDVRALGKLIERLDDTDGQVRATAAMALGELALLTPAARVAIPALATALGDEDLVVKCAAALALGKFGGNASEAVPSLIGALRDPDLGVAENAAQAIEAIGPPAAAATAALMDLIPSSGSNALSALAAIGPAAIAALPMVENSMSKDGWEGIYAAKALWRISGETERAADALLRQLRSDQAGVRRLAAEILGEVGLKSDEVKAALTQLLQEPDCRVRNTAAESIRNLF